MFYLIASLSFWLLLVTRQIAKPFDGIDVVADRALAWTSLALLFGAIACVKLGWVQWHTLNWLLALTLLMVTATGLWSVRQMTRRKYGDRVWLFYLGAITLSGGALWLWA